MEAHCIALELKYQNHALKSGQHVQILNETSNKAKIKRDIDEIETINIELEHSVAKLLIQNKHLNKENKTLKKHYKDLYDSIKITRSKTIEQTTYLLANNADLKAQIQENVFAIAALKNYLRKLKGNSIDTKFAKTSVLGKPITADGSKPIPRSNNQTPRSLPLSKSSCVTITVVPKANHSKSPSSFLDSKQFVCSTIHKCVFNANHDACITKLLKEVNSRPKIQSYMTKNSNKPVVQKIHTQKPSRAKIQSHKTRNNNKPVDQKSHTQKPGRHIFTGHKFSPNKTSDVFEKTSPRSDLRWKPTGRILKSVGLKWIPTGKLFDSYTSKVDSEPPHGSNVNIPNNYECKQTLDVTAGTSINVHKELNLDLSAGTLCNVNKENLRIKPRTLMSNEVYTKRFKPRTTMSTEVHQAAETVTTSNELDLLFGPLFNEYFNGENQVVSKSSTVTTTDASNKRQQQPDSTSSASTLATTVTANGNFDL
ncbi:hypothetical protein Tco_0471094 [Tanacetum coccineum]